MTRCPGFPEAGLYIRIAKQKKENGKGEEKGREEETVEGKKKREKMERKKENKGPGEGKEKSGKKQEQQGDFVCLSDLFICGFQFYIQTQRTLWWLPEGKRGKER